MSDIDRRFSHQTPQTIAVAQSHDLVHSSCHSVARIIEQLPESRERALAITKLEEVMFWADAAIARYQRPFPSIERDLAKQVAAAAAAAAKPAPPATPAADEEVPAPAAQPA